MRRIEGWEGRLETYLKGAAHKKFEWGAHDCVLFTMDWFLSLTNVDIIPDIRGKYSTEEEALALIESFGGLIQATSARIPTRPAGFEKRGDLALCEVDGKETMGIVASRGFIFFVLDRGLCAKRVKPICTWGVD